MVAKARDVFVSNIVKDGRKHPLFGEQYRFTLSVQGRTEDHVGSLTICRLLLKQLEQPRGIQVLSPVVPVRGHRIEFLIASELPIEDIEYELEKFCSVASELTRMDTTSSWHDFMNEVVRLNKLDRHSTVLAWIEDAQNSMAGFLNAQFEADIFPLGFASLEARRALGLANRKAKLLAYLRK
jgi:hypothetical protein